jgi:protein-S-isoprenylcysteine O-methyltransferase Ste14
MEPLFLWAGGAAFVGSLALSAYVYLMRWSGGGELAADWPRAVLVNAVLFAAFAAHHSLFARDAVKARMARFVAPRLNRSVYVWVASGLLVGLVTLWNRLGGSMYHTTGPMAFAHLAIQVAGLWLIVRAVAAIDGLELAGIRRTEAQGPLVARGPYRLVRHPLYLGWVLIVFGPANMTGDRLLFAVLTTAYLAIAVPWEERSLERAFGGEYARYRAAVRWRIVPGVY